MVKPALRAALARAIAEALPGAEPTPLNFERPRDPAHGDLACNVALQLARTLKRPPQAIAEALAAALPASPAIAEAVAVAPGFLNFRLSPRILAEALGALPSSGRDRPAGALAEAPDMRALRLAVYLDALAGLEAPALPEALKSGPAGDDDHTSVGSVVITKDGKPAGEWSPQALIAEVGEAAVRFFCLTRPLDRAVTIDLAQAQRETASNPLFYLRHGHARLSALLRLTTDQGITFSPDTPEPEALAVLSSPEERSLLLALALTPDAFDEAAEARSPHWLVRHGLELSETFDRFYTACRILGEEEASMRGRLTLVAATRKVLRSVLEEVVRIPAPEALNGP